jgi:intracellular multiplication protein IcmL
MTQLREPMPEAQAKSSDNTPDLGHAAYEAELLALARTLHHNIDAIDPLVRDQKERKNISKYSSAITKSNMVLTCALLGSVALNGFLAWYAVHPDRQYFAADGTRVIRLVPLSQPYLQPADVIQFARDTINRSLTLNFEQYRQQLEDVRQGWTQEGFKQYLNQLQSGGYLDSIKAKRMNMTVTAGTGVIVRERLIDGVYVRTVELPIEIKLAGQVTEQPAQSFIAVVTVARIPTLDSLVGVGLDSIVIKPR